MPLSHDICYSFNDDVSWMCWVKQNLDCYVVWWQRSQTIMMRTTYKGVKMMLEPTDVPTKIWQFKEKILLVQTSFCSVLFHTCSISPSQCGRRTEKKTLPQSVAICHMGTQGKQHTNFTQVLLVVHAAALVSPGLSSTQISWADTEKQTTTHTHIHKYIYLHYMMHF